MPQMTRGQALDELYRVRQEFAAFKDKVRETAIRVAEEQSWCDEGVNDVLTDLGLPGKVVEYDVTITLTIKAQITTTNRDALWTDYTFPNAADNDAKAVRMLDLLHGTYYEVMDAEVDEVDP